MNKKYDDIINLPHYTSKKHPRMSLEARSAQFAPFAALTGYSDAVKETARLTDKKIENDENLYNILDYKLNILEAHIKEKPYIRIVYFVPDKRKDGGKYVEYFGNLRRIDIVEKVLIFTSKKKLNLLDIIDITCDELKI